MQHRRVFPAWRYAFFDGLPIAFLLTGGEASDSPQFATLLEIGPDVYPRAAIADKAYDAQANRKVARAHGVCPAIPYHSNVKNQHKSFPKILYAGRARIEITVGKIKRFKRIALRCGKTAINFASLLASRTYWSNPSAGPRTA